MRRASRLRSVISCAAVVLFLGAAAGLLLHSADHGERDGDCAVCLAHVGTPAHVRDSVPIDVPSDVKHWTGPELPAKRHAGHGLPFCGRAPPASQV